MTDVLTQLLGFRWRAVSFPVTEMTLQLRQDLVQHKYFLKDGADVEATGRAPLQISATIPFRNNVARGLSEEFRVLYPDGFRAFLAAMADRTVDYVQHPELGPIRCRPEECSVNWTGMKRDGVDVTATWIETTEFEDSLQDALALQSPIAESEYAAIALDSAFRVADEDIPKTPEYQPDFSDTMRGIAALGDQVSLASGRVTGKIDQVAFRVSNVKRAFERANNPKNFPVQQALERMTAALRGIHNTLAVGKRPISFYRAPRDITLAGLASVIPANLTDLMRLNPRLMQQPIVLENTAVQFIPLAA